MRVERGFCEVSERCRPESTYSVLTTMVVLELAHGHFDLGTVPQVQSTTLPTVTETADEPQPLHRPNAYSCANHSYHPPRPFSVQVTFQRLLALEKPVKVYEVKHAIIVCRNL